MWENFAILPTFFRSEKAPKQDTCDQILEQNSKFIQYYNIHIGENIFVSNTGNFHWGSHPTERSTERIRWERHPPASQHHTVPTDSHAVDTLQAQ